MEQIILCFFTELYVLATARVVFPTRAALYLNDLELLTVKSALSSLLNCHKLLMYLSNYHYIQSDRT